ncbi:hypothetical protein EV580_4266 [Mycobacterium sp. BK086]|uniref:hypothetical protein n=1 Tax=Mycobacterium sp. BK086 TaxID=2512165 RepID=UPI001060C341|nr:hypothetical protein [Mycobacterium sp. BK086]TDO09981.1 hypothetical protein EV580_4266 [Mycobacterium sp. BK086]
MDRSVSPQVANGTQNAEESNFAPPPGGRGRLMLYATLIVGVLAINAIVLVIGIAAGWWADSAVSLQLIAAIAQVNLLVAVLHRQQWMVSLIGFLATNAPKSLPLAIRWRLAQYYHFGGVHIGAAIAGTLWYVAFLFWIWPAFYDGKADIDDFSAVLATVVVVTMVVMCILSAPDLRTKHHELFEFSHRFGSWTILAIAWANTFALALLHSKEYGHLAYANAVAHSPVFWMLVLTTFFAAWPWILLRRVPISVECPSDHMAIVRLHSKRTPPIGTTRSISRHPLQSWHPFACVPAKAGEDGYRMMISRAGEWTSAFIDNPPSHIWVRGISTPGVANAKRLFNRVLYIATGSGIGPILGHLLTDTQGAKLVWVTRTPRETFGDALVDEITSAQPDAVIWNTRTQGKPDVFEVSYQAFVEAGADAVIIVSNRSVTTDVVSRFERRGVPAFGPIWDS